MVLFRYYSLRRDTAMPGGLHARLCHVFLVYISLYVSYILFAIPCWLSGYFDCPSDVGCLKGQPTKLASVFRPLVGTIGLSTTACVYRWRARAILFFVLNLEHAVLCQTALARQSRVQKLFETFSSYCRFHLRVFSIARIHPFIFRSSNYMYTTT